MQPKIRTATGLQNRQPYDEALSGVKASMLHLWNEIKTRSKDSPQFLASIKRQEVQETLIEVDTEII